MSGGPMQVNNINHVQDPIVEQHPIYGELNSIELILVRLPGNNEFTESIAIWHAGFVRALNHPNPQMVIDAFVKELELILRFPGDMDAPLPREIFEETNPLVRQLISRMTDRHSSLYSERIAQEAQEAHQRPHLPPDVIEQIRRLNALRAAREQEAANYVPEERQLNVRLQQHREIVQAQEEAAMQRVNRAFQDLRGDIAGAAAKDLGFREVQLARADQLRNEARELRAEANRLQGRNQETRGAVNAVEQANIQMQVEINNTRAAINDRKSGWLEQVACIVISVVISWALKKPVIVTPNGATVGL